MRRNGNKERETRKEEQKQLEGGGRWRAGGVQQKQDERGDAKQRHREMQKERMVWQKDRSKRGELEIQLWSWFSYSVVQFTKTVSALCHRTKTSFSHGREAGSCSGAGARAPAASPLPCFLNHSAGCSEMALHTFPPWP